MTAIEFGSWIGAACAGDVAATSERIWRNGRDLFEVVEVEAYRAMRLALQEHPANVACQKRMSALLEVEDDYSETDTGLRLIWELANNLDKCPG